MALQGCNQDGISDGVVRYTNLPGQYSAQTYQSEWAGYLAFLYKVGEDR